LAGAGGARDLDCGRFAADLVMTVGATLLALALGAATLRRRTP
jgi:hypothetical protein